MSWNTTSIIGVMLNPMPSEGSASAAGFVAMFVLPGRCPEAVRSRDYCLAGRKRSTSSAHTPSNSLMIFTTLLRKMK
jgi:hypothetical protein